MTTNKTILISIFITLFIFGCNNIDEPLPNEDEYGTGLKPNSKEALEQVEEVDFDENALDLPSSFAFDGPPIENQEETSKCVAFSGAYYIISLYNGLKSSSQNYDKASSPEFAYAYYKKTNKDTDCNEGAYMFDEGNVEGMAEFLKNTGTTSWNQVPFVNTNTCTIINNNQLNLASNNKISDYARLDEDEYKDNEELKSWIYAGYPLWFAVNIDDVSFQDLGAKVWSKSTGKDQGGHAMTLVGWDDSRKAFKFANSWGKDWGDNGYGWVDYAYFQKLLAENGGTIGVLFPNERQKKVFDKLTPSSCGNAGWGELQIENNLDQDVKVTISATNYLNDDTSIDKNESEFYYGLPKGTLTIKTFTSNNMLIKEYKVNIEQCNQTILKLN